MPDIEGGSAPRFEWGLIADLQPPDVETRIAILRKKSEDERIALPEEVIHFLATTMKNNIRELEGSLVRVGAYSSLTGQAITPWRWRKTSCAISSVIRRRLCRSKISRKRWGRNTT